MLTSHFRCMYVKGIKYVVEDEVWGFFGRHDLSGNQSYSSVWSVSIYNIECSIAWQTYQDSEVKGLPKFSSCMLTVYLSLPVIFCFSEFFQLNKHNQIFGRRKFEISSQFSAYNFKCWKKVEVAERKKYCHVWNNNRFSSFDVSVSSNTVNIAFIICSNSLILLIVLFALRPMLGDPTLLNPANNIL